VLAQPIKWWKSSGELTIGKLHPIWTNTAESSRTGFWVLNLKLCKSYIGRTVCLLYSVCASAKCGICNTGGRRMIRLIESNAKCRWPVKGLWGKCFMFICCLRPHPLLGFCLGWCSNYVGSESCQKQSVKLLQNRYGLQHNSTPPPPPLPATQCLYICTLTMDRGGGVGEVNQRE
jgi:hypothetical protein